MQRPLAQPGARPPALPARPWPERDAVSPPPAPPRPQAAITPPGPPGRRRLPRLAILTMVYNEADNLPIWLAHYRRMAPHAALFVLDHGSTDGSTASLADATRIPLPRTAMDEWARCRCVRSQTSALLQYYDVAIYSDCDELIAPDPAVSPDLEVHLAARRYDLAAPIGLNVQHIVSHEPKLEPGRKLLAQRRFAAFRSDMCKPLVTRVRVLWKPGFHGCDRKPVIDPDLYLFHIKAIDRDRALARQHELQQVVWTQQAVEARHGAHHRFDDQQFLRQFFLDPANVFGKQGGPAPFEFTDELARLRPPEGAVIAPPFNGPIVEIPERFRNLF